MLLKLYSNSPLDIKVTWTAASVIRLFAALCQRTRPVWRWCRSSAVVSPWTVACPFRCLLTPATAVRLNLTRVNIIISLNLGWSRAIQDQAFDRIHHLGQTRPVEVQRLVIPDTVEDHLLNIQECKVWISLLSTVFKFSFALLFSNRSPMEVWERARERTLVIELSFLWVHCKGTWSVWLVNCRTLVFDCRSLANLYGLDAWGLVLAR